jgi:hypothetical protein
MKEKKKNKRNGDSAASRQLKNVCLQIFCGGRASQRSTCSSFTTKSNTQPGEDRSVSALSPRGRRT